MISTELAIKTQIEDIIIIRNQSIEKYKNVLDSVEDIEKSLTSHGSYLTPNIGRMLRIDEFTKELDKGLWNHCFDKLGVFMVMNSRSIEALHKEIDQKTPEFTEENVLATMEQMYENRKDYFVQGIVDTFKFLSPNHKTNTNDKFKIPDKCIISYMIESNWDRGLRIRYGMYGNGENKLCDIQRIFCILDKKEFKERQIICEANEKLKTNDIYENEYLELKGYKNGNAHIKFKRIDLLDNANQLIAEYYGNALK